MLKYSFSILFCLLSVIMNGQEKKEQKKDTTAFKRTERFGVRIGLDLSKFARSLYDKNYKGLEIVGDYRLTKNFYLAAEIGNENKITDERQLNFTTKGSYIKVGFDYNFYKNWLNMENMIHLGLRYDASTFSQELNSYKIYDTSTYFPVPPAIVDGTKYDGLSAQWIEVVAGIKAKLFNNFYGGISVRANYLASQSRPDNFDNLYIPGFNRTYNGSFGAGWNYTLTYFVPIYKKKKK